ncbi:unnamed protein product [Rotaria sordida]|uniref:Uncharacterized protein n=1 Tax=Rotaria sordida TaxID=392033 RepID=A0A814D5M4_9BILA|nr:unnamed protein product [Rotaria sordida]
MIKCIESKKANRTYVVVRNATKHRHELFGFRIFDSKEKTCLYRLRASSRDIDTVILVDNPTKNMVANLEGIWIDSTFNVTLSVYDYKLNKWIDGVIQRTSHFWANDYTVEYNNEQLIAKWKLFSTKIKVYHKKQNELLAQFRPRTRLLLWRPVKYDLKIYSNKVPDAIYFFLLLIFDHRGLADNIQ